MLFDGFLGMARRVGPDDVCLERAGAKLLLCLGLAVILLLLITGEVSSHLWNYTGFAAKKFQHFWVI